MATSQIVCGYSLTVVGPSLPADLAVRMNSVPIDLDLPRFYGLLPSVDARNTEGQNVSRQFTLLIGTTYQSTSGIVTVPGERPGAPIESVTLPGGLPTNYGKPPVVSFADLAGSGRGAQGYVSSMGVGQIFILNGGVGYTSPPTVTFVGGAQTPGGIPATATASILGGLVTGVTITSSGTGYTQFPELVFEGGGAGVPASAVAGLTPLAITLSSGGVAYTQPQITLTSYFRDSFPDGVPQVPPMQNWMTVIFEQMLDTPIDAAIPVVS